MDRFECVLPPPYHFSMHSIAFDIAMIAMMIYQGRFEAHARKIDVIVLGRWY
jgi:hypothetical protein